MNILKILITLFFFITFSYAENTKVTLQLQWKHQFQFAGYYMAKEKGFYNDVNLNVELLEYSVGTNNINNILSGKINYATGRSSLIIDRSQGKKVVLLASVLQSSPLAMVTKKSSNIDTIKKFANKRFSLTNNEAETSLYPILLSKNVNKDLITINKSASKVQDFIENKTDIITLYTSNQEYTLIKKGIQYNIFYPKDYGFEFYDDILYTSQEELEQHKKRTMDFTNASLLGWNYAFNHIEETVDIILKKYNTQNKTKDELLFEAKTLKKLAYENNKKLGDIDKNKIQRIFDIYNIMGLTKSNINIDNFIFDIKNYQNALTFEEKNYLKQHPYITVHNEYNWPPYNFNTNGEPKGYSIDYMNLIAKKLNINIKYVQQDSWSDFMDKFKAKDIDVMLNIVRNNKRDQYISFTDPYAISTKTIFTNDKTIQSFDDLKNKVVSVQKDSFSHNYFKKNYPNIQLYLAQTALDSIIAVINGKADAVIENFAVVNYILQKNSLSIKYTKISEDPLMRSNLHIATLTENEILRNILQKGMDKITVNEKIELQNKWLGTNSLSLNENDILTNKEKEYINQHKIIKMCNNPAWEPIEFAENSNMNKMAGIAIDTLEIIEKKLNIKFQNVPTTSWKQSQEFLKSKKCDILPSAIQTKQREEYAHFTKPYLNLPLAIFTSKNKPITNSLEEIMEHPWARQKGSGLINQIKKIYPQSKVVETKDAKEALQLVNNEKVYFSIMTLPVATNLIAKYGFNNIQISGYPNITYKLSIAVRKDDMILRNILDKALDSISEKKHREILKSWTIDNLDHPYLNFKFLLNIFIGLLVLAGFIFFRQYLLKKSNEKLKELVNEKTKELVELNLNLEHKIQTAIKENRDKDKILDAQSRMVSMGEMIGNIAHQWRQPLSVISTGVTGMLVQKEYGVLDDEKFVKTCNMINENAQYLSKTIDDFKNFIKGDRVKKVFIVKENLDTFTHLVEGSIKDHNINVIIKCDETLTINGYENELSQCFINIFNNAKDALKEIEQNKRIVMISVYTQNESIVIDIQDNAKGIAQENIEKIFEPYFTTKHQYQGTGLGLNMTYKLIVEGMNGNIVAMNQAFEYNDVSYYGALFRITLPMK
ncbi:MAG: transporter substrate-binding domain-containing protein [Arcobacteraceae bacterium]